MIEILTQVIVEPFQLMREIPDLLVQTLWEGLVAGILYALIALGFVLIFKASGVFNFAQGIMVVFAALALVALHKLGMPAWIALILAVVAMGGLAWGIERIVLRPLVGQSDAILLMATIGLTYFLQGAGETIFGGEPQSMITEPLGLPTGATDWEVLGGIVTFQHIDVAAIVISVGMVANARSVLC